MGRTDDCLCPKEQGRIPAIVKRFTSAGRRAGTGQVIHQDRPRLTNTSGAAIDNVRLWSYFDLGVSGLPQAGQSVNVVVPQRAQISDNPVYRKYDSAAPRWRNFIEDARNMLAAARGSEGQCSPPDSTEYRMELHPGDWRAPFGHGNAVTSAAFSGSGFSHA